MVILNEYIGMDWFMIEIDSWIDVAVHEVTYYFVNDVCSSINIEGMHKLFHIWDIHEIYMRHTYISKFLILSCTLHRELAILDCNFPFLLPFKFLLHRSNFLVLGICWNSLYFRTYFRFIFPSTVVGRKWCFRIEHLA